MPPMHDTHYSCPGAFTYIPGHATVLNLPHFLFLFSTMLFSQAMDYHDSNNKTARVIPSQRNSTRICPSIGSTVASVLFWGDKPDSLSL